MNLVHLEYTRWRSALLLYRYLRPLNYFQITSGQLVRNLNISHLLSKAEKYVLLVLVIYFCTLINLYVNWISYDTVSVIRILALWKLPIQVSILHSIVLINICCHFMRLPYSYGSVWQWLPTLFLAMQNVVIIRISKVPIDASIVPKFDDECSVESSLTVELSIKLLKYTPSLS